MGNIIEDRWMTEFYGKKWFKVVTENFEIPHEKNLFFEWRIDASKPKTLQKALNQKFELVETAVEFETIVFSDTSNIPSIIRTAENKDLEGILKLVDLCYINHSKFYNRFKNKKYFSVEQSRDYFRQGIINNFNDKESIIIVAGESEVVGFYILKKIGDKKYKGISTGVDPRIRGQNLHIFMQRKCSDVIKEPYTMINRTQLNNYKVINNHISERKKLVAIEHILYLKPE